MLPTPPTYLCSIVGLALTLLAAKQFWVIRMHLTGLQKHSRLGPIGAGNYQVHHMVLHDESDQLLPSIEAQPGPVTSDPPGLEPYAVPFSIKNASLVRTQMDFLLPVTPLLAASVREVVGTGFQAQVRDGGEPTRL